MTHPPWLPHGSVSTSSGAWGNWKALSLPSPKYCAVLLERPLPKLVVWVGAEFLVDAAPRSRILDYVVKSVFPKTLLNIPGKGAQERRTSSKRAGGCALATFHGFASGQSVIMEAGKCSDEDKIEWRKKELDYNEAIFFFFLPASSTRTLTMSYFMVV